MVQSSPSHPAVHKHCSSVTQAPPFSQILLHTAVTVRIMLFSESATYNTSVFDMVVLMKVTAFDGRLNWSAHSVRQCPLVRSHRLVTHPHLLWRTPIQVATV